MSDAHSPEAIKKHVRTYLVIFGALLAGTIVTVWLRSIHFGDFWITVAIALTVATIKASLVAGFFMHLISERKAIYATLATTVFFFAAMMYLTVWARVQVPRGSEYLMRQEVPHPAVRNGGAL
ncbi:MAG TPA: cytochrome C oxidase subunit IV family protein [Verrucomicrobiae bacterium]|jgi:cytochrome c oxidase subunit 4|nr:cytochrome C oxidase subunit IV family protein [Verrucomicrobiae bacterium]